MIGLNHQFSLKNLASKMQISKDDIKKYLPHREPFLFIDEVVNIDKNNEIHARKMITSNEYFLKGHFPGNPIFPGVIIIEALGQASGILGFVTMDKTPESIFDAVTTHWLQLHGTPSMMIWDGGRAMVSSEVIAMGFTVEVPAHLTSEALQSLGCGKA